MTAAAPIGRVTGRACAAVVDLAARLPGIVGWLRRYIDGARLDGSRWSCTAVAWHPVIPFGLLCGSVLGTFDPMAMVRLYVWLARSLESYHSHRATYYMGFGRLPVPPWIDDPGTWLALAAFSAVLLYLALRRVGRGSARRGLFHWMLCAVQIGGCGMAAFGLWLQFNGGQLWVRATVLAIALAVAACGWACYRLRVQLTRPRAIPDPMFSR